MTTARGYPAGCGTQTAGLAATGYTGTANTNATEEYTGAGTLSTKTVTAS